MTVPTENLDLNNDTALGQGSDQRAQVQQYGSAVAVHLVSAHQPGEYRCAGVYISPDQARSLGLALIAAAAGVEA